MSIASVWLLLLQLIKRIYKRVNRTNRFAGCNRCPKKFAFLSLESNFRSEYLISPTRIGFLLVAREMSLKVNKMDEDVGEMKSDVIFSPISKMLAKAEEMITRSIRFCRTSWKSACGDVVRVSLSPRLSNNGFKFLQPLWGR